MSTRVATNFIVLLLGAAILIFLYSIGRPAGAGAALLGLGARR